MNELWKSVCITDPNKTRLREVNTGRHSFTAIDAYSQIARATELWGPMGNKWSLRDVEYDYTSIPQLVIMSCNFCYPEGKFPISTACKHTSNKGVIDDDCMKKIQTDIITKALSYLGFNADIFMGKFDGNKYTNQPPEPKPAPKTPTKGARVLTTQEAEFVGMAKNHFGEKWPKIEAWTKKAHTQKAIEDTLDKLLKECPKGFAITDLLDLQEYCLQTMYTEADEPQNLTDAKLLEMSRREFKLDTAELSAPQINHLALLIESEPPF